LPVRHFFHVLTARHPVMKKTSSTPALPGKKADSGSDRQKR
jgi:hypothetical protein